MDKSDYTDILLKFDDFSSLSCELTDKISILQDSANLMKEELNEALKENSILKDRLKEYENNQFDEKIFEEVKKQTEGINVLCNEISASSLVLKLRFENDILSSNLKAREKDNLLLKTELESLNRFNQQLLRDKEISEAIAHENTLKNKSIKNFSNVQNPYKKRGRHI